MLAFFSVHLKQLREAKKLTQTQVANYVGVSRSVME
jgi:transcriptional regulator with XRE-family HTH domain